MDDLRPSETTADVDCVEFVGEGEDRPAGVYVTMKVHDPEVRWSAGRVAIRYIK
jgi:hypothetical protein